jgi:hypothetical protein
MSIVTYNNRSIANISAIPGAAKSLTLIKTLTANSSTTINFVHGTSDVILDSTYPIYLFKFINFHPSQETVVRFQGSINGGSSYGVNITSTAFRTRHYENDGTAELGYRTGDDLAQSTSPQPLHGNLAADNDQCFSGELTIFNPSSTTFVKHFMSKINSSTSTPGSANEFISGYFNTTSAINAIQFDFDNSANFADGIIKLYGIKDS